MNYDRMAAAVIVAASLDRPARGPVDGLQSGQVIGGAALGTPLWQPRFCTEYFNPRREDAVLGRSQGSQSGPARRQDTRSYVRVLILLREAFGQPSLNRTAGVRTSEEERSHCRR